MAVSVIVELDPHIAFEQGQKALLKCDLEGASAKFIDAGRLFFAKAQDTKDKQLKIANLYNSAAAYFHGGSWAEAQSASNAFSWGEAKEPYNSLAPALNSEASKRSKKQFWDSLKNELREMRQRKYHKDVLNLLQNNPYLSLIDSASYTEYLWEACTGLSKENPMYERAAESFAACRKKQSSKGWAGWDWTTV